ncbi:hypothetical protein GCM10011366_25170 [Ornithinimicrobium tianjinense]|uniref:Uncharacterized protein n=1 Tax=Ornithinimicrobium tianjinense TaxID=1195761 RepID=A0A917BRP5_9MICO|nr:hypothetical protein GCM10011366_25170 [Ornithinimicrobium tianjinense]
MVGSRRPSETIRKDLVYNSVPEPLGRRTRNQPEVVRVRNVPPVHTSPVVPNVLTVLDLHNKSVINYNISLLDLHAPPTLVPVANQLSSPFKARLVILKVAHIDTVDLTEPSRVR